MFIYFLFNTIVFCSFKVIYCDSINELLQPNKSTVFIPEEILENSLKGGIPTDIESFPFLVSIQKLSIPRCVGSLISAEFLITAAHCLIDLNRRTVFILDPYDFVIISGRTVLSAGSRKGQARQAKQFIIHSRFDRPLLKYDVGIIQTTKPFVLGYSTYPTKLYSMPPEVISSFQSCTLIGWDTGKHSFDDYEVPELNPNSMKLQAMTMKVMTSADCQEILERLISLDTICARLIQQCPGQSGSPLICGESLFGIFTWTAGCRNSSFPAVFIQISKISIWINNAMNELYVDSLVRISSKANELESVVGLICFCITFMYDKF